MAIAKIRIQAVRGIRNELTLDLGGSSLVVRGDNGTGKSSIVAGLLWALRGEEEPSTTAKAGTEASYRANVLDGASKSQVILDLKGGGSITVKPTELVTDGPGKALRAGCERSSPFLLRKHLLKFLEDRPVDRFKYLEAFLDLEKADDVREAFGGRALVHENQAIAARRTCEQHLRGVVAAIPGELAPKTLTWSTTEVALVGWAIRLKTAAPGSNWEALVAIAAGLRPLLAGESLARKRLALQKAVEALAALAEAELPTDPAPLLERLVLLLEGATDASLATLLEEAGRHSAAHPADASCPVCQQDIDPKRVSEAIRTRLHALAEIQNVRAALVSSGAGWKAYWATVNAALSTFAEACGSDADASPLPPAPAGTDGLQATLEPRRFVEQVAVLGAPSLLAWVLSAREHALAGVSRALAALPSEDDTSAIRKLVQAIEQAEKVRLAVAVAEASSEDAATRASRFRALEEALRTARQDVAKELLDDISALVSEFYGVVHPQDGPDEITGPPEIVVQRRSGGTAVVRGKFHAKAVDDPRWVYSDGHLDTVGICVFLALRRFRADRDKNVDPKLMILDDIVLSVDLGHGRRLLDLLRTRFGDHQVFIFTHNGLFSDWCAQRLQSYKRKAIAGWSVETGPQLGEYPSMLERIEGQIATESSPKLLAQAVMNVMDEWLGQARFEYLLPVQAKRGEEYTLTEIWEPFSKRLKEIEKALGVPVGRLGPVLVELVDLPSMRNRLAAHDNDFAREYPLSVVRGFAKHTVELVRILYCNECATFAMPVPSAKAPDLFRCSASCERIRFDRPKRPGPPAS